MNLVHLSVGYSGKKIVDFFNSPQAAWGGVRGRNNNRLIFKYIEKHVIGTRETRRPRRGSDGKSLEKHRCGIFANNHYIFSVIKYIPFLTLIFALAIFQSCTSSENNEVSEGTENQKPTIDPNGPDVEVNVLSFDLEKNETTVEIINRLDEPITNIRGRLYFYDESGALLMTATGRDLSSPFQTASNPHVVASMEAKEIVLKNSIPEGTNSIKVEEIAGKTNTRTF